MGLTSNADNCGLSEKEEGEHEDNSEPGLPDTEPAFRRGSGSAFRLLGGYEIA